MLDMFQPPRGTRDFLPEQMKKRKWVLDQIREVYENYGFDPLGTPAFESWDLLKIKSGEEIIDQIYYFKDKSERELGLRFEWTASLARVVASHRELHMPFKRYAIGPVWRYERPSENRYREFWQADADIVGVYEPIADAEVLAAAVSCLKRLGLNDFNIRLNDRRILEAFVDSIGVSMEKSLDVFRSIDKLEKIGKEEVQEELADIGISYDDSQKLLTSLALSGEPKKVLEETIKQISGNEKGIEGCKVLSDLVSHAEKFGIANFITVDLSLARGLDYYTGPVFEVGVKGHEGYGSIAGGGRYDEIIELFGGEPTPATGISFGVERLVTLLEDIRKFEELHLGIDVFIAVVSESVRDYSIAIAQSLRNAGIPSELNLLDRALSKQFEHADRKNAKWVIIVGERERSEESVTIRDMKTGDQTKIKSSELVDYIKSLQEKTSSSWK